MDWVQHHFNRLYWGTCFLLLIGLVLRCIYVPFAHDEVATFHFYIQSGAFIPFHSHVDAGGHFLMSASAWLCYKIFGSSTLALRLPNLLAFMVLCYAVARTNRLFMHLIPKILLSAALIGSFQVFAFYSLCRGYAISIAFLVLALYYFTVYAKFFRFKHLVLFLCFLQIALSANLTLVFVALLCSAMIVVIQIRNQLLFNFKTILIWLLHGLLIYFWITYAFYLQKNGALYYGEGSSYWKVTFVSLIESMLVKNEMLNVAVLCVALVMFLYFVYELVKKKFTFLHENSFALLFTGFLGLVLAFFLLKKILHINYPEDRTGIFFYVFFILALAHFVNGLPTVGRIISLLLPLGLAIQFVLQFNWRAHPWRIYETIPESFMRTLQAEQDKVKEPITIAGHRVREFIYGFMNYNSTQKLNHITAPEALQMNCDYAIAYKVDEPYYRNFYSELQSEPDWNFVLLKRKTKLDKTLLYQAKDLYMSGESEYYNAIERLDTTFEMNHPLQVDVNFNVEQAPVPFNAWLVLQVDSKSKEAENVFVRIPLNLITYNWNGTANFTTSLVSGNVPMDVKRLVCYLWNIDKKQIRIKINSVKLYRLDGEGVTFISKANI